jgi:Family of unknown function (DUF6266)
MGTIQTGILGGFNGKVGTVVGSNWKGISTMRALPKGRKGNFSPAQLQQQARFALMISFLQPLSILMNVTYKKAAIKMSGFNKVFSENVRNAIAGVYPAFTIDYPKVVLSRGPLANVNNPVAVSTTTGKLVYTWTDNTNSVDLALSSDIVFLAAYNEALNQWVFLSSAAARNAGTFTLDVSQFAGKPVHTYIGIMSADRNRTGPSIYTGQVNVL